MFWNIENFSEWFFFLLHHDQWKFFLLWPDVCCQCQSSMIIMDMLENMLAEASSSLDTLATVVHLSPETAGAVTNSAAASTTVTPCRSNISTPSPPPCDDYDDPKLSRSRSVTAETSLGASSDVLSSISCMDDQSIIKTSVSPLFSLESSSLQLQDSSGSLQISASELNRGNSISTFQCFWSLSYRLE